METTDLSIEGKAVLQNKTATYLGEKITGHCMEHLAVDADVLAVVKVLPMPEVSLVVLRNHPPLYHSTLPQARVLKNRTANCRTKFRFFCYP